MQTELFFQKLHEELVQRGISGAAATQYVRAIAQNLSEQDIADIDQIQNDTEIAQLAQGIVMVKKRSEARAKNPPEDASQKEEEAAASPAPDTPEAEPEEGVVSEDEIEDDDSDMKVYRASDRHTRGTPSEPEEKITDNDFNAYIHDDDGDAAPSQRGKRIFWLLFICTLPITLILLLAYFSIFGAAFAALCATIVLLVAGLIGGAAIGAAVSLIGIVYGITQLITVATLAPGLYEIGLGVTVGGIVLAAGILVYNIAVRLIPLLIRLLAVLFRLCTDKLRILFHMAKEACYKL